MKGPDLEQAVALLVNLKVRLVQLEKDKNTSCFIQSLNSEKGVVKMAHDTQHNDTQHNDIQHNDIQNNAIQHNDIQRNAIQRDDIQLNNTHHNDFHYFKFLCI